MKSPQLLKLKEITELAFEAPVTKKLAVACYALSASVLEYLFSPKIRPVFYECIDGNELVIPHLLLAVLSRKKLKTSGLTIGYNDRLIFWTWESCLEPNFRWKRITKAQARVILLDAVL